MKYIILLTFLASVAMSNMLSITSFEADFIQSITNDKGNKLEYKGHVQATKPQFALWNYTSPVEKKIYINMHEAIIIEPEIEQVIIKKIEGDFDFFRLIKNAKKTDKNLYTASFEDIKYSIKMQNKKIKSISYLNKLENLVEIIFTNQIQNKKIDTTIFNPNIPMDYDVIRG